MFVKLFLDKDYLLILTLDLLKAALIFSISDNSLGAAAFGIRGASSTAASTTCSTVFGALISTSSLRVGSFVFRTV